MGTNTFFGAMIIFLQCREIDQISSYREFYGSLDVFPFYTNADIIICSQMFMALEHDSFIVFLLYELKRRMAS